MATPVLLPRLGNTVESSIIVRWLKRPGDRVAEGEPLCEIDTDKTTIEVESPGTGVLLDTFFPAGADVPVLTTIAVIGEPGEDISGLRAGGAAAPPAGKVETSAAPEAAAPGAPPPVTSGVALAETAPPSESRGLPASPPGVSPRARHLAEDRDLDLAAVRGTGPGGRIIERDVEAALAGRPRLTPLARAMVEKGGFVAPPRGTGAGGRITAKDLAAPPPPAAAAATAPPAPEHANEYEQIPLTTVRRIIAERMLASLQTTAQLTLNTAADARALQAYRARLKASPEALGLRDVTINDLVLFVVSRTLPHFPDLNALFTGNAILRYRDVHLGMAVDTPRGLLVPVIRRANQLSLQQISREARRLAQACQDGRISPDEFQGGTFTVTNLGSLGIESFTPILNPPQVAILGVGAIHLRAVEAGGEVAFFPHLGLSLTINHQVVDGGPGARFLQELTRNFANLELLLAV